MPNRDTGHYFLTVLAPVKPGCDPVFDRNSSYRQQLLETLARLPNSETTFTSTPRAQHLPGAPPPPAGSPFARNTMNHLARFVVIDDPVFTGRDPSDPLLAKLGIGDADPLQPQPVDRFSTPFLLFAADIDADPALSDADVVRRYADTLWDSMAAELRQVFGHCIRFEAVEAAAADPARAAEAKRLFHQYIVDCQVETTMPFNDYWPRDPETGQAPLPPDLPVPIDGIKRAAIALAGLVGLWLVAVLAAALLPPGWLHATARSASRIGAVLVPLLLLGGGLYLFRLYRSILAKGAGALPAGATLPAVLKALYLQQGFIRFAIAQQGEGDAALHAAFGAFLKAHQPDAEAGPTQPPGIIRMPDTAFAAAATAGPAAAAAPPPQAASAPVPPAEASPAAKGPRVAATPLAPATTLAKESLA